LQYPFHLLFIFGQWSYAIIGMFFREVRRGGKGK